MKFSTPRRAFRWTALALRRIPFTLTLLVLLWIVGIISHSIAAGPSLAVSERFAISGSANSVAEWWRVVSSVFFAGNFVSYGFASLMILGLVGLAETTMGWHRTALAFIAGHFFSIVSFFLLVWIGTITGFDWLADMRPVQMYGPFAASVTAVIAASPLISSLWRRRLRLICGTIALMLLFYIGHPQSVMGVLGMVFGFAIGRVMHGHSVQGSALRSTGRETRVFLAMIVAVFAAGPALANLAHAPVGPLAQLRGMIVNPLPSRGDLLLNCQAAVDLSCRDVAGSSGLNGPGSFALSLVPFLLLLVCAAGLRRGSRMAFKMTIAVQLLIGILSIFYLQLFVEFGQDMHSAGRVISVTQVLLFQLPVILVPFAVCVLLWIERRRFTEDANDALRRKVVILLPSALGIFLVLYAVAWFAEGNDYHRGGLLSLVAGLPRILLPYPFPYRYSISVQPHGFFSSLLFSYGGAAFWLVCLISLMLLFVGRRLLQLGGATDFALARKLVHVGGDSLSWMALWPGNSYWFNATHTAGIAYQQHNGVAVTVGGPFGRAEERETAIDQFAHYCAAESLAPCIYSATDTTWPRLEKLGFRRVGVAQETLLNIRTMQFSGKEWQNVRTAVNKAKRLGVSATWYRYSELPLTIRTQIHEISEAWVAEKSLPEMGFTLGGVQELMDDEVQICVAVDAQSYVHGVMSWLPVFEDGTAVSWTMDFMRRNFDGFGGTMEFLIASAVSHFRDDVERISLSGSPLVPSDTEEAADFDTMALSSLLNALGRWLEPVYGFRSLAAFKQRFQPEHRTLYMMYADPLALPAIGRAVTEAYTPNMSVRQTSRVLREIIG